MKNAKREKVVARKKIVVLGSANTDMVIAGRKIPVPGETVSGGRFRMTFGAKGVCCGDDDRIYPARKVKAI